MPETDIELLKKHYAETEFNLKEVKSGLNNAQQSLIRLETALLSDPDLGRIGLVDQIKTNIKKTEQLEKSFLDFVRKYEDNQLIKKTAIGIYGGLGAAIMLVAKWLGGLIINHLHF